MSRTHSLFVSTLLAWPALAFAQGSAAAGHMVLGDGGFLFYLIVAPALGSLGLLAALLFKRQWRVALKGVSWCLAYFILLVVLFNVVGIDDKPGFFIIVLAALAPAFSLVVFATCTVEAFRPDKSPADRKAAWAWILAGFVAIPTVAFIIMDRKTEASNARVAEQDRQNRAKMNDAFAAWCKGSTRVVHKKASPSPDATLVVKVERQFHGRWTEFWAHPLAMHAARNAAMCGKTSVTHLAGLVTWEPVPENGQQLRFYALCEQGLQDKSFAGKPRYELLLGESAEQRLATPNAWMYKSSVRLVDTDDGATLAEDSMYFLLGSDGEAGCSRGLDRITSLIAEVFPK